MATQLSTKSDMTGTKSMSPTSASTNTRHSSSGTVPTVTINGREYTAPFHHLLPPLPPEDLDALEQDVLANGLTVQVVVTPEDELLDGYHRAEIAARHGLANVPLVVKHDLSPDQKRETAVNLNLHRRHLSGKEKQRLIAAVLRANPEEADNRIARRVRVDPKTVKRKREAMEARSEIPKLEATVGRDGKTRRKPGPRNPLGGASPPTPDAPGPESSPLPPAETVDAEPPPPPEFQPPPTAGPPGTAVPLEDQAFEVLYKQFRTIGPLNGELRERLASNQWSAARSIIGCMRRALTELESMLPAGHRQAGAPAAASDQAGRERSGGQGSPSGPGRTG